MKDYLGILIKQSLSNQDIIGHFNIIGSRKINTWNFLLDSVPEGIMNEHIQEIQDNMIYVDEDCWYNHYFRDEELIVVYEDKIFHASTNPATWDEIVEYGIRHNIPRKQLDFNPRTLESAYHFFGIPLLER